MNQKIGTFAGVARLVVWVVVTFWCWTPIIWMLFVFGSSLLERNPQPQPQFIRPPQMDQGLLVRAMSSAMMAGAFLYGMWCMVGVAMGIGMERTISAIESVSVSFTGGPKKPPGMPNPFG